MNSIICPIIRYDVFPICNCPCMGDMGRDYDDSLWDKSSMEMEYDNSPSYDSSIEMRFANSDGYILTFGGLDTEEDDNFEWNEDEAWRCGIYKNIGPRQGKSFTLDEAIRIGRMLGIDWETSKFDAEQYRTGLDVELEHGRRDMLTNVTNDDPILTGKIALAHLNELPDYYTRLKKIEQ